MVWGIIIIIIIVLIVLIYVVTWLCNSVLFCPSPVINRPPKCKSDYRDLYVSVKNPHRVYLPGEIRTEECINVWFFPNFCGTGKSTFNGINLETPDAKRRGHCNTTILYFHGNSGNISHRHYVIDICRRFNINLLLVDYRGYGRSDGVANATSIYQDGEVAYNFLTGHVDCDNIIVWGESLGGTVACHIASKYKCRALILLATFSSLEDVINEMVEPRIIAKGLSLTVNNFFHPMNSKHYIRNLKCPVAIMHSRTDSLIPYHCSEILFDSIPNERKVLFTINGDHASPKINDETLKQMFAFVGVQAECMDHHISYVIDTLAGITNDNPGLMPESSFFSVNI